MADKFGGRRVRNCIDKFGRRNNLVRKVNTIKRIDRAKEITPLQARSLKKTKWSGHSHSEKKHEKKFTSRTYLLQ